MLIKTPQRVIDLVRDSLEFRAEPVPEAIGDRFLNIFDSGGRLRCNFISDPDDIWNLTYDSS